MAVVGKRTRAEKHDNADDQQSQDSQEKNVGTFTIHGLRMERVKTHWCEFFVFVAFGIESFCPIFNLRGSSM